MGKCAASGFTAPAGDQFGEYGGKDLFGCHLEMLDGGAGGARERRPRRSQFMAEVSGLLGGGVNQFAERGDVGLGMDVFEYAGVQGCRKPRSPGARESWLGRGGVLLGNVALA
ncbi:hypothetical protein [Streptomyces sp. NPDC006638]|uniref:hypothetical protein n=1 Tax=Streptomyces sp. NPDC006638 TaxID=3157183 RepID=UPI0033B7D52E